MTVASSIAARGIGVSTALISIPLTVRYLGTERYGLWVTLSSVTAMLAFADFGIGNGLLNVVSEANGNDDVDSARKYVSSSFFMLAGIALVAVLGFAAIYSSVPWPRVFNVASASAAREAGPAMAVFFACFAVNIPMGIVQRVQSGYQEGFITNLWQAVGGLLGLVGLLAVIWYRGSLPWLVFAVAGASTLTTGINWLREFRFSRRWLFPTYQLVRWRASLRLARIGLLFFVLQVSGALTFASDNVVATQVLGPAAAARYSVAQRMFMLAPLMVSVAVTPLWPAYGEALARGDRGWVRRTFFLSSGIALLACAIVSGLLIVFSGPVFTFWVGAPLVPPLTLMVGLAIWALLYSWGATVAMLLNAANVVAFQVVTALCLAGTSILLKIVLTRELGISGIVWALIASYTLVVFVPTSIYVARRLKRDW